MAAKKGLILVDTKYEFGKKDGKVYLIDEIHTPDSSRYFYADGYQEKFEKGEPQKQLSKEFVRQWLIDHNFMGKEGQQVPEMTDEYVNSVSDRYIELYEHIVGQKFNKADNHDDLAARIEKERHRILEPEIRTGACTNKEKIKPYKDEGHKREQVERMFDRIAHSYDRLNHFPFMGYRQELAAHGRRLFVALSPRRILDVATGTGDFAILSARRLAPQSITGVDISEA